MDCAQLAASPAAGTLCAVPTLDRKLEDWLVCQLDDRDLDDATNSEDLESWLAAGAPRGGPLAARKRQRPPVRYWTRFRVLRVRSITVVTVLDSLLIRDDVIRELADELQELTHGGPRRLVLDLQNVDRLSSQNVAAILALHRRCAGEAGGRLKLCGVRAGLAELFVLSGLAELVPILPDVRTAISGAWPMSDGPRPLPVSLLRSMRTAAQLDAASARLACASNPPAEDCRLEPDDRDPVLRVDSGRHRGRLIPLLAPELLIGRGSECRLRCSSPMVSRLHALVVRDGASVRVLDCGSSNGTMVNGRPVPAMGVCLRDGDRITIGPLELVLEADGQEAVAETRLDDLVVSWVDPAPATEAPGPDPGSTELHLQAQPVNRIVVIGGVVVVTPLTPRLDEAASESLRETFQELESSATGPLRIVVDCEYLRQISSRAVAVLLAQLLRTESRGGGLRLAQVHDMVLAVLEQTRLPMLLEIHATLDDAVIRDWA